MIRTRLSSRTLTDAKIVSPKQRAAVAYIRGDRITTPAPSLIARLGQAAIALAVSGIAAPMAGASHDACWHRVVGGVSVFPGLAGRNGENALFSSDAVHFLRPLLENSSLFSGACLTISMSRGIRQSL